MILVNYRTLFRTFSCQKSRKLGIDFLPKLNLRSSLICDGNLIDIHTLSTFESVSEQDMTKIIAKSNSNRILPAIKPPLRINQNGFRPGRTTTSHILALRCLIEGIKDKNLSVIIIFIDFKKAFDTIHCGKLIQILRSYGIPEKLVRATEVMYMNTKAKMLSPDGETELFHILAGVLQGDTLAPSLFIIALDFALGKAINEREEELGFQIQRDYI